MQYLLYKRLPRIFDKNVTSKVNRRIQRFVVQFALLAFLLHLFFVFLGKSISQLDFIFQLIPPDYLTAIYTPFSIILFYEIFELVIIIPKSTTSFVAKQYEVISLIFIREVFKDTSHLHNLTITKENSEIFQYILSDIATGIGLFFLVVVFYHINHYRQKYVSNIEIKHFINVKKSLSLLLGIGLILLAFVSFFSWGYGAIDAILNNKQYYHPIKLVFYKDFFTVLVFVDIFLLILSLVYTKSYEIIFRNAAFGVSTILIRLSLTSHRPMNQYIALGAVGLGVITLAIFVYYHNIMTKEERIAKSIGQY